MAGHDAVVHFAAESHVDRSIAGPDDFINTNCFGTNIVMDTARRLDIGRVVHIGTDEVYGSVARGIVEGDRPPRAALALLGVEGGLRPDRALVPPHLRPAGHRHALHQQLRAVPVPREGDPALHHQPARGHAAAAVRRRPQRARLALRRRPLRGRAPGAHRGSARRDLQHRRRQRDPEPRARRQAARAVRRRRGDGRVRRGPPGHDRRYSVDIAKVTELGWQKQRTLDEALEQTVAWYRDNAWWWEPLKQSNAAETRARCASSSPGRAGRSATSWSTAFARPRRHRRRPRDPRRRRPRRGARGDRRRSSPDVIVHAAAWTAVDACEGDPNRASREHRWAPRNVADAARARRRPRRLPLDRLRVRRHQARALRRDGTRRTRSRCTGGRSWAASRARRPTTPSCASRGCAASTATTW